MSYETSPILNRIKITKGWKNPTFPTKTLNYSREMLLWFKVYLFLKVYLWCQNIRLLTCEIRISEVHTKILYLSISKHIPKKKNVKSKWKTKSILQKLKSPLVKKQNKRARFLLYRDLRTLKKKSEFFFNMNRNKIYSKAWISKSRQSSWINFSHMIHKRRIFQQTKHNFLWRKKKKITFLEKKKRSNVLRKNQGFWKKTQKNIFGLLVKFQKDLLFLEKILNQIPRQNFKNQPKSFQSLAVHLNKEYQKRKTFLEKIEKLYKLSSTKKIENETQLPLNTFSKSFANHIYQQKVNVEFKPFWFFLKKKWRLFQKQFFFKFSKKKRTFASKKKKRNKKYFLKYSFLQFLIFCRKKIVFQKFKDEPLFKKIKKILFAQNLNVKRPLFKARSFKKLSKLRELHVFRFVRFEQKKKRRRYKKKLHMQRSMRSMKNIFKKQKNNPRTTKKIKSNRQKLAYRLSFRYNYRSHLTLKTDLKLKYIIADIIQQYFLLITTVKLFWPLKQFKNLKFYRLIFPDYQKFNFKKRIVSWNLNKKLRSKNKRYVYIGQNTNHLKIQREIFNAKNKSLVYKQVCRKKTITRQKTDDKKKTFPTRPKMFNKMFNHNLSNFWQRTLKKKNKYLILKKKVIQNQSQKRLFWASKQPFMSNLTSVLTLFAKYLEVQPLADYLAKIIGDTKKHALILKIIKTVLRTVHFKRGIGYRIALIGRINGANKSRTLYLKKLNRNRARQTLSKNVNFAMAQARATIGAFGVKIWVYS
jgi:hypothetical protein